MAQAKEDEINRATQTQQHVSMQMSSNFSRDLLQRFISGSHFGHKYQQQQTSQDDDNEEIELSLGLSLNGRFGIDPTRDNNKLIRSSSIPDFLNPISRDNDSSTTARMIHMGGCSRTNLTRACSLPTETEEEWRKRKELQTLRRMEAKRKRSEKKAARERNRGFGEENGEEDVKREEVVNGNYQQDQCVKVANENLPFGGLNWVNGGARGGCGIEVRGEKSNGFVVVVGGGEILPPAEVIARAGSQGVIAGAGSQGSTGSQGSGSSGISEFESQPIQGMNKGIEARSPASVQSLPQSEQKSLVTPGSIVIEKSGNLSQVAVGDRPNKPTVTDRQAKETVRNVLEDMPCVSTKGDGPNGKRIEGFLYRYRKGEEVRIVCVCHGSFLSPAEFVKHAGGGDVAHPLKHIVVSPSSPL